MQTFIKGKADEISRGCGTGYSADIVKLKTRPVASAYTNSWGAMRDNLRNNTLLKELGKVKE
jgi:hypothetical protein